MHPTQAEALPPLEVLQVCLQILGVGFVVVAAAIIYYLWRVARSLPSWEGIRWSSTLATLFLMSGATALFLFGLGPRFIFPSLGLGCGAILALGHPVAASGFLIASLVMRPWEIMPGNAVLSLLPKLAAGISCFSWLFFVLRTDHVVVRWDRGTTLVALLFLWIFVSVIAWGADPESLQRAIEALYPIIVLFFLVANSVQRREDLMILEAILGVVAIFTAASAGYLTYATTGLGGSSRLQSLGVFGNSNDLGALVVIGIAYISAPILARRGSLFLRGASLVGIILALLALMATQSRTVILALGAMGVTYTLSGAKISPRRVAALGVVGVVALGLVSSIQREATDLEGSSTSRFNYVLAGINMVKSYPFVGVGFGNYSRRYEEFTPAFVEWGERTAHSSWVLIFSETGPIGLFLFASLVGWAVRRTWRARFQAPEMLLALVGYGVMISFLSHTYLFPIYLLLALASVAPSVLPKQKESEIRASNSSSLTTG